MEVREYLRPRLTNLHTGEASYQHGQETCILAGRLHFLMPFHIRRKRLKMQRDKFRRASALGKRRSLLLIPAAIKFETYKYALPY